MEHRQYLPDHHKHLQVIWENIVIGPTIYFMLYLRLSHDYFNTLFRHIIMFLFFYSFLQVIGQSIEEEHSQDC